MEDATHPDRTHDRTGQAAVISVSQRTGTDAAGYAVEATAMENLAAVQPGYRGLDSVRGDDGFGITISRWADEAAAIVWRGHPQHRAIRAHGRADWYDEYDVAVAVVARSYRRSRG